MNDPMNGPPGDQGDGQRFSWSARRPEGSPWDSNRQPPIYDPFLNQPPAPPAPQRSPVLAIVAITMTVLFLGAAALAAWLWFARMREVASAPPDVEPPTLAPPPPPAPDPSPSAAPTGSAPQAPPGLEAMPRQTKEAKVGTLTVVDLGMESRKSLADELTEQRAQAQAKGQTLVLMTTHYGEKLFTDVDAALPDPLLQKALKDVRLVRADVVFFSNELEELGVPTDSHPWFTLLGPDLVPRDGINGGEWEDDIPRNIAPVLGAFVRGSYKARREMWKPPKGKGIAL